jgi:predicted metal-binding protein
MKKQTLPRWYQKTGEAKNYIKTVLGISNIMFFLACGGCLGSSSLTHKQAIDQKMGGDRHAIFIISKKKNRNCITSLVVIFQV